MNSKLKIAVKMSAGLIFGLTVMATSQAEMVVPPNIMATANMTFDQRLNQMHQLSIALLKATPGERKEYWMQIQAQVNALSPKDQQWLAAKLAANSKAMTPAQVKALNAEQAAYYNALTPEEQAKVSDFVSKLQQQPGGKKPS